MKAPGKAVSLFLVFFIVFWSCSTNRDRFLFINKDTADECYNFVATPVLHGNAIPEKVKIFTDTRTFRHVARYIF